MGSDVAQVGSWHCGVVIEYLLVVYEALQLTKQCLTVSHLTSTTAPGNGYQSVDRMGGWKMTQSELLG